MLIIFILFILNNCSSINTEPKYTIDTFHQSNPKILLMPIDIEICEITIAGLCEPNANWTENSKKNMKLTSSNALKKQKICYQKFNII